MHTRSHSHVFAHSSAIGGRPLNTSFNIDTKIFRMCFMVGGMVGGVVGGKVCAKPCGVWKKCCEHSHNIASFTALIPFFVLFLSVQLDPSQNVGSPDDGAETEIFASIKHIYPGGAAVTHMTDNLKLKGTKPITRPEGIVANVFMISPADPSHGKEDACVTVGPA